MARKSIRLFVATAAACAMLPSQPLAAGPAVSWFLWETTLEAPGDGMLALPEERGYEAEVSVGVDYWVQNDDGSAGPYLGHESWTSSAPPVCYADAESTAEGFGQHLFTGFAEMLGQHVAAQVGQFTTQAAKTAAQQASPLNPVSQWGSWYSSTASYGSHLAWRFIGFSAGAL